MRRKDANTTDTTPDMFTPSEMGVLPTYSQPALIETTPEPKKSEPPPKTPGETPQTPRSTEPATLVITHANARGTGARATFRIHPAHGIEKGRLEIALLNQLTIGDYRGPTPKPSTFDDAHPITAQLEFLEICKLLQVFRGEEESIENEKGLYFRRNDEHGAQRVLMRHIVDPIPGYVLEMYETDGHGHANDERRSMIMFSHAEALGIALAIEHSLSLICFGMPLV